MLRQCLPSVLAVRCRELKKQDARDQALAERKKELMESMSKSQEQLEAAREEKRGAEQQLEEERKALRAAKAAMESAAPLSAAQAGPTDAMLQRQITDAETRRNTLEVRVQELTDEKSNLQADLRTKQSQERKLTDALKVLPAQDQASKAVAVAACCSAECVVLCVGIAEQSAQTKTEALERRVAELEADSVGKDATVEAKEKARAMVDSELAGTVTELNTRRQEVSNLNGH
eukprot:2641002-Rhodomonas_salina.3